MIDLEIRPGLYLNLHHSKTMINQSSFGTCKDIVASGIIFFLPLVHISFHYNLIVRVARSEKMLVLHDNRNSNYLTVSYNCLCRR
jgi:hypothetical protein